MALSLRSWDYYHQRAFVKIKRELSVQLEGCSAVSVGVGHGGWLITVTFYPLSSTKKFNKKIEEIHLESWRLGPMKILIFFLYISGYVVVQPGRRYHCITPGLSQKACC
jgi:hypothetical protein